jgi:hypothetical protein
MTNTDLFIDSNCELKKTVEAVSGVHPGLARTLGYFGDLGS